MSENPVSGGSPPQVPDLEPDAASAAAAVSFSVTQEIRATHHYGFRSGQWARILSTVPAPNGRDCYLVQFPDGVTDWWLVNDPSDPYEFR